MDDSHRRSARPDEESDPIAIDRSPPPSRRHLLWIAAGCLVTAPVAGWVARLTAAQSGSDDHVDHDDDDGDDGDDDADDDDSSGRGRGRGRGRGGRDDDTPIEVEVPAGSLVINIFDDDNFTPSTLTIDAGQMVTFVNHDGDDHTATGAEFDTGLIPERGGTASVVLDTPGVYLFSCLIHPEMVGELRVRDAAGNVPARTMASPVAATPAADGPAAGEVAVAIIDLAFEPQSLAVPVGTTVVWTNTGQVPHTVTADAFSSEVLEAGQEFEHAFSEPGTFDYLCAIHPQMTGQVQVESA